VFTKLSHAHFFDLILIMISVSNLKNATIIDYRRLKLESLVLEKIIGGLVIGYGFLH
jgi:hypothetical protein